MKPWQKISLWTSVSLIAVVLVFFMYHRYQSSKKPVSTDKYEAARIDSMHAVIHAYGADLLTFDQLMAKADSIVRNSNYNVSVISAFTRNETLKHRIDLAIEQGYIKARDKLAMLETEIRWLEESKRLSEAEYERAQMGQRNPQVY